MDSDKTNSGVDKSNLLTSSPFLANSFGWLTFDPEPGLPFDDAVIRLGQMPLSTFNHSIQTWSDAFPIPQFETGRPFRHSPYRHRRSTSQNDNLPRFLRTDAAISRMTALGPILKSVEELRNDWINEAGRFFIDVRETLKEKNRQIHHHIDRELRQQEVAYNFPLSITVTDIATAWMREQQYIVAELYKALLSPSQTITSFVADYVQRYCAMRQLTPRQALGKSPTFSSPPPAKLHMLATAQTELYTALASYVAPNQLNSLSGLLTDGIPPAQPIRCNCDQVTLGAIFYQQVKEKGKTDKGIQTTKTSLARWICFYFFRLKGEEVKHPDFEAMLNYLKGKGFRQY